LTQVSVAGNRPNGATELAMAETIRSLAVRQELRA
jgi:hypothetical protein